MEKPVVHIAMATDEIYVRYMAATVASAIQSAAEDYTLAFHILADALAPGRKETMEAFIGQKGHSVNWLQDTAREVDIPLTMYFTRAASMRLFLADMVSPAVERIVYLDSDTVVCPGGIARLAAADIGAHALGVVTDVNLDHRSHTERLDITEPAYRYFNSGVLVINLAKWRAENASQKHIDVLNAFRERLLLVDQDVLNQCWQHDICTLPLNFNLTSDNFVLPACFLGNRKNRPYYTAHEIKAALQAPYVLHYVGSFVDKPWRASCYHPRLQCFIDAANASPFPYEAEPVPPRQAFTYRRVRYMALFDVWLRRAAYFVLRLFGKSE